MASGLRYRIAALVGTIVTAILAVLLANNPTIQYALTTYVPVVNQLQPVVLREPRLELALLITIFVVFVSLLPLFKPRPRRILDIVFTTHKRTLSATFALATIGYFDYTYRLPRSTLLVVACILFCVLPVWFVFIRWNATSTSRAVIVGDSVREVESVLPLVDVSVIGYVAPRSPSEWREGSHEPTAVADGGHLIRDVPCLGGPSRLDDILVAHNVDTAVLVFETTSRADFFGTVSACYDHGVTAKIPREHSDGVLTQDTVGEAGLVDLDLEPWDWQDYAFKRLFDVVFAAVGLLVLSPLMLLIAIAIEFDSAGPTLYSQTRTAAFGEVFEVYKFRTMYPGSEDANPVDDEYNDRITRVGRVLRKTHLDELPQLWSILVGDMSVVGPRAAWTEEEMVLEAEAEMWRKRWFVRPGLTGLAQVNGVTSTDPQAKLRYDLEYIRDQSLWLDLKIVVRQVWLVGEDLVRLLNGRKE